MSAQVQVCSICGRDPRRYLAEGAENVCRGCVAEIAARLEGDERPRCVCGNPRGYTYFDDGRPDYHAECNECFTRRFVAEFRLQLIHERIRSAHAPDATHP
jgi:hypothetical protein